MAGSRCHDSEVEGAYAFPQNTHVSSLHLYIVLCTGNVTLVTFESVKHIFICTAHFAPEMLLWQLQI